MEHGKRDNDCLVSFFGNKEGLEVVLEELDAKEAFTGAVRDLFPRRSGVVDAEFGQRQNSKSSIDVAFNIAGDKRVDGEIDRWDGLSGAQGLLLVVVGVFDSNHGCWRWAMK